MRKEDPIMRVKEIYLPPYTRSQEAWNALSHFAGVLFALIAMPFAITKAALTGNVLTMVAIGIYSGTFLLLYAGSAIYHALDRGDQKRIMRVIDHDNVFLLIMGSYTPYCWIALANPVDGFPWGWVIFGLVWGLCGLAIVLNSIDLKRFKAFSALVYVGVASAIVTAFYPLYFAIGLPGVLTLLCSGFLYWIGAMLYGIGSKKSKWFHTVFHFFVLAATIVMFFGIYIFVL